MKQYRNRAGRSTYELADRRRKNGLFVGIIILLVMIFLSLFVINPSLANSVGGGSILIILALLYILRGFSENYLDKNKREEKRAIKGADAEVDIADTLNSLDSNEFVIFHDIKSPYGNIDHVVIKNTGGIFLIETKSHYGKVSVRNGSLLVNGKNPEKDFINQVLKNTLWLKERIEKKVGENTWIVPILVFSNAFVEYTAPIHGINILNIKYLIGFIQKNNSTSIGGKQFWTNWKIKKDN